MNETDRQQQKVNEFMRILPLTLAIAGLSTAPTGGHLTEGQLEARATTLRTAYKVARQVLVDIASAT